LVSGGFVQMIKPVCDKLRLSHSNLFANTLLWDENGVYVDFDKKALTSNSFGKAKAIQQIQEIHKFNHILMIGDGATDLEAKPPAKWILGFGGIVERKIVKEKADFYEYDFHKISQILKSQFSTDVVSSPLRIVFLTKWFAFSTRSLFPAIALGNSTRKQHSHLPFPTRFWWGYPRRSRY